MRHLILALLLTLPLAAQVRRGDWVSYPQAACIGGSNCPEKRIRIELEDRPVLGIRFTAHDQIGETAGGELRIKIGAETIRHSIDIPRRGETFTIDVDNVRGQTLTFEPASYDEIDIKDIAVLYGGRGDGVIRRDGPRGGGWRRYTESGCIGGSECRKNGTRFTVVLDDRPVLGVRFYAHDNHGTKADGKLNVRIDDTTVASYIDVQRDGKRHEFDVDNVLGSKLVISTANDDEVTVSEIEVLYGRPERRGFERETLHEGGCVGGTECGGRRARLRVPLRDREIASVRFYAHDNVGTRAGGELRVRVDDQPLREYIDVPRDGRTFTIEGKGVVGQFLIIEPTTDDEVVIRDVRVEYVNN